MRASDLRQLISRLPVPSLPVLRLLAVPLVALGMAAALSGGASAQEYQSTTVGGPGGAPFTMRCAQGDYLVGVGGRSGAYLDAIAPLCANWDMGKQAFLAPGLGPMKGGTGGGAGEYRCDNVSVIVGFIAEQADNPQRTVGMLSVRCAKAVDPDKRTPGTTNLHQFGTSIADRRAAASEPGVGTSVSVDYDYNAMPHCNKGDVAVGIFGAAGTLVDRIGLICARAPRMVVIAKPVVTSKIDPNKAKMKPDVVIDSKTSAARIGALPPISRPAPACLSGYVWREASPADVVCVTPESRARVKQENAVAATRVDAKGAYGPNTCIAGFVWREAFQGDVVCVTPEIRETVRQENAGAASRTAPR